MQAQRSRFTRKQVLRGLQSIADDLAGSAAPPIRSEMRVDQYWQEHVDPELDFLDLIYAVQRLFNFELPDEAWHTYLQTDLGYEAWQSRYAPHFTFGNFAEFIRCYGRAVSLQPVTVFGRHCAPAGAFLGIQALTNQINPLAPRIGPSSPITGCLRGQQIHDLWQRLQLLSEQSPPDLRTGWRRARHFGNTVGTLSITMALIAMLIDRGLVWLFAGLKILETWKAWSCCVDRLLSPLPNDCRTFGDLALLVARPAAGAD